MTLNEFFIGLGVEVPVTAAVISYAVARGHRTSRDSVMSSYAPRFRSAIRTVVRAGPRTCCLHTACSEECARTQQSQHQTRYALGAIEALKNPDAMRQLVNDVTRKSVYDAPGGGIGSIPAGRKTA
jgi:hypothetical protein